MSSRSSLVEMMAEVTTNSHQERKAEDHQCLPLHCPLALPPSPSSTKVTASFPIEMKIDTTSSLDTASYHSNQKGDTTNLFCSPPCWSTERELMMMASFSQHCRGGVTNNDNATTSDGNELFILAFPAEKKEETSDDSRPLSRLGTVLQPRPLKIRKMKNDAHSESRTSQSSRHPLKARALYLGPCSEAPKVPTAAEPLPLFGDVSTPRLGLKRVRSNANILHDYTASSTIPIAPEHDASHIKKHTCCQENMYDYDGSSSEDEMTMFSTTLFCPQQSTPQRIEQSPSDYIAKSQSTPEFNDMLLFHDKPPRTDSVRVYA